MTIRTENRLKEGYHFQKTRRSHGIFLAHDSFPRRFPPLTIGMLSAEAAGEAGHLNRDSAFGGPRHPHPEESMPGDVCRVGGSGEFRFSAGQLGFTAAIAPDGGP
jgi:hypothetical protein